MMTPTQPSGSRNDEFRLQLGLFVLGALPIDEHLKVEQHLAECADCRAECDELSDVPAMFSSLSTEDMRALADEFAPASSRRRRSWLSRVAEGLMLARTAPAQWGVRARIVAVAAAVALVVSIGIGVALQWSGGGAADVTVAAKNEGSGARASIVVTRSDDGSAHVEATLSGLEPGVRYELLAVAVGGRTAVAARWEGSRETSNVTGDVGFAPDELAFFTVAKRDGSVVLTVRVHPEPGPS